MVLRPLTLIGIIVSIVTGISLGVLAHVMTRDETQIDSAGTLTSAMRQVSQNYVEEVSEEELLGHALKGMMGHLDDHSNYLDSGAFSSLKQNTSGRFGGIGLELGMVDGYFTVVSPLDGTPADRAGLLPGDRITRLDGDTVKGMLLVDLIDALRGDPGSTLQISVQRESPDESSTKTLQFDLTRAVIQVASVRGKLLEPGYGYVRISQFQTSTGDDLADVLKDLESEAGDTLQGLVMDLRNNPGGTLQSSVEVADHFLERGLIVYTEGRLKSSFAKYRATRGDLLQNIPIVVLINGGSASASEIVAGALQDHGRAKLLGATSYGKGSVQSVLPLSDKQALKLTTAYYFTPTGRSIHEKGIDPDVEFEGEDSGLFAQAVQLLKTTDAETLQARL
jgi:carboxyl-terminal processing protease